MAAYSIRDMTKEDISNLMEIEEKSFPTPWSKMFFKSVLSLRGISINKVILEDDTMLGYISALVEPGRLHLLSIAVRPEKRRLGIGSELLRSLMEEGVGRGVDAIVLEVRHRNEVAQLFYLHHGFKVSGRLAGYYTDTGEDALVMSLELAGGDGDRGAGY